ncbi:MAG: outer membrane beta-barrel protein [Prevotellaceae bacterium]|nr:outer membrane beta-barrel protein [Candidatus Minthosoma caballi]MBQ0104081.1 outer membrane beta-barrel protein [Candidatus Colivivens caballi]
MKKVLLTLVLALTMIQGASAQFEQGKKYVGASLTGLNLSFSDMKDFAFGLDANAGYFIERDLMLVGNFGVDTSNGNLNEFTLGAKARYYLEQNGLYLAGGLQYRHFFSSSNDLQLTPEVGYCYFLNRYITVEPAIYFDLSLTDFSHKSEFGLKCGIGIYF